AGRAGRTGPCPRHPSARTGCCRSGRSHADRWDPGDLWGYSHSWGALLGWSLSCQRSPARESCRGYLAPRGRFVASLEPYFMPDTISSRNPALLSNEEAAALVAGYPPVSTLAARKDIGRLDPHLTRFIGMAPICFVATASADGKQDVTPRGDPPGSFKVIDEHTLALADRPGNN